VLFVFTELWHTKAVYIFIVTILDLAGAVVSVLVFVFLISSDFYAWLVAEL